MSISELWVKCSGICELSNIFSSLLGQVLVVWIGLSNFHLTNLEALRIHRGISELLTVLLFTYLNGEELKMFKKIGFSILEMHCTSDYYTLSILNFSLKLIYHTNFLNFYFEKL